MRTQHSSTCARINARVAVLTIISLLAPSAGPIVAAQAPAAKPPAAQTPTAKPPTAKPSTAPGAATTAPAPPDGGWPRNYTTPSGAALVIYQPQLASRADQKHATLYAAVSYTAKGAKAPALGTVKMESETERRRRRAARELLGFQDRRAQLSTLERDAVKGVVSEITTSVPLDERVIALDVCWPTWIRARSSPRTWKALRPIRRQSSSARRPRCSSTSTAIRSGPPIPENDLRSAVNTNWDLFEHGPSKTYYLRNDRMWLKSSDVKGPWTPAGKLPPSFEKLPADENWKDVKATLPGQKVSAKDMPKVFVSLEPAELILLKGSQLPEGEGAKQLLWVSNTDSDVFRMGLRALCSSSSRADGSRRLISPAPGRSPRRRCPTTSSRFLSSTSARASGVGPVPTQAAEAVLLAEIPQTARVSKRR